MHVRLTDGVWASTDGTDIHIGVLEGDIDQGWSAKLGLLPSRTLPAVIRRLNLGGVWTDGRLDLSVASGVARLAFAGTTCVLDVRAAARLQVFATHVRLGLRTGAADTTEQATPVRVATERGGLRVVDAVHAGTPLADPELQGGRNGTVLLALPTDRGMLRLDLPALPLLVAAAEASADASNLVLRVPRPDAEALWLPVGAANARQVAAEAQWLLPAFARRLGERRR